MSVISHPPVRVVNGLIVSSKRTVGDDDALEPFDRRHRVPARHYCTQRKPVLRGQLRAIHFVGQQHVAARFAERNAPRELQSAGRTLWILKYAAVGSFQSYFARV